MSSPRQNLLIFLAFSALIRREKTSRMDLNMVKWPKELRILDFYW